MSEPFKNSSAIQLTDPPEVVRLKEEFFVLDEREQILKRRARSDRDAAHELQEGRRRKQAIAMEINRIAQEVAA
jgi:hypothetical protein